MIERPILMSAPMVRAVLDGTKTQTRRIVRSQFSIPVERGGFALGTSPYGNPGDRLWLREAFRERAPDQDGRTMEYRADGPILSKANDPCGVPWTPSIHMPRWASRITLEVTAWRVERLQDISEADARAEGISEEACDQAQSMAEAMNQREPTPGRSLYEQLWTEINGAESWAANPWVWVVEFRRLP